MTPVHWIAFVWLLALSGDVFAQPLVEESEWRETFPVEGNAPVLVVSNIWGPVSVTSGPAGVIEVNVRTQLDAPDERRLERTREIFAVDVTTSSSTVELNVGDSYHTLKREDRCRRCKASHAFEIVVPEGTSVDISTVNDGVVRISGVKGPVSASNVNGPVSILAASACDSIEAINGDVELEFSTLPNNACSVETINGDIRLGVPPGSGLDVALDLFNGRVTSEFDVSPITMPAVVEKSDVEGQSRYRISQSAGVRIGRGGPLFTIASLNGDVNLVKKP